MQAAVAFDASLDSSWSITREGVVVAAVDIRQDGGEIVVIAGPAEGARANPHRFSSLQAADSFLTDLMASFAYLGCEVAPS